MVDENKGWDKRVDELGDKDMIKPEQQLGMKSMLDSPDKENGEVVKEIVAIKIEDRLVMGLNGDQTNAFNDIVDFFKTKDHDAMVLKGYAGTGKTFLVRRLIEYITAVYPSRTIAITAPTNKAVRVLQGNSQFSATSDNEPVFQDLFKASSRLTYSTVHKLLGLKENISNKGVQTFKAAWKEKSAMNKYNYVIIDEVSMLDDQLCREIMKFKDKVKIIFMGDPAQIPPVNRVNCIPFNKKQTEYNFREAKLLEIMRQKGEHPVVDASFIIRNNLNKGQPILSIQTKLNAVGHGVVHIPFDTEGKKRVKPLLEKYFDTDAFRADADHAKVIAWTNARVGKMNRIIRRIIFGTDIDAYVVGEKLVANGPLFKEANKGWGANMEVYINTSEEMEITDLIVTKKKFSEGSYSMYATIYECTVSMYSAAEKEYVSETITIIHEDSMEEYKGLLKKAKSLAENAISKSAWKSFYTMLKWSADVGYNYAITCHKAQGSTYKNVILMEEDIDNNPLILERNRIKYTAYSRPTDKLFIVRKNY
jgi:exodeoxyribonuclease-5